MLDGGKALGDQTKLRDLRKALANRNRFHEVISQTPARDEVTWKSARLIDAIRGLGKFLAFCVELEVLLDFASDLPMLRSAMWHYHSYWFGLLSNKVGVELPTMVEKYGAWLGGFQIDLDMAFVVLAKCGFCFVRMGSRRLGARAWKPMRLDRSVSWRAPTKQSLRTGFWCGPC